MATLSSILGSSYGSQGLAGSQGATGNQGVQGLSNQGVQGALGAQGILGSQGTLGSQGAIGRQGTVGAQGITGVQGQQGLKGTSSTIYEYLTKTTQTSGYPGDGFLQWNNATQTSATEVSVSHLTRTNIDIEIFLDLLENTQTFAIQDDASSENYQVWTINGTPTAVNQGTSTAYWTYPVTLTTSGGTGTTGFANNTNVFFAVTSGITGPEGAQGTVGSQGIQGIQGTLGVQGTAPTIRRTVGVSIDGGGAVITTGTKGYVEVPYSGTIVEWKIISDVSGSVVFDVWKSNAAVPTNANTITASAKPTLTTAQRAVSTTLTGWTTSVSTNDVFGFEVESASTLTKATLILVIQQA